MSGARAGHRWPRRAWLRTALRIGLGSLWIYAGLLKVLDPPESLRAIRAYHLFPEWAVVLLGYAMPFFELTLGVLLVAGLATRVAAAVSTVVLAAFMVVIASAWARDLQIACGCFGDGGFDPDPTYLRDLGRDALLLLGSAVLVVRPRTPAAADGRLPDGSRRRRALVGLAGLVLLGAVTGAGLVVQVARLGTSDPNAAVPHGTVDTFGIPEGSSSAPVEVTIYEDFQCSFCARLEAHVDGMLDTLVAQQQLRVVYRPVAILDRASTTGYSTRALNAAACTLDLGGTAGFARMHDLLFAHQPAEGTPGPTDEELTELAVEAGVSRSAARRCIRDRTFAGWAADAGVSALANGVTVLPDVRVDGEHVEFTDREVAEVTLRRAIDEALAASGQTTGAATTTRFVR